MAWPAYSICQAQMGAPLPVEGFRQEDPRLPRLDKVLAIGDLIVTSYNSGPYLVDEVSEINDRFGAHWSITGFEAPDGVALAEETRRFWINELVAIWDGEKPRICKLFANNNDQVFIIGRGFKASRAGQMRMF